MSAALVRSGGREGHRREGHVNGAQSKIGAEKIQTCDVSEMKCLGLVRFTCSLAVASCAALVPVRLASAAGAAGDWTPVPGGRWQALSVPASGQTGFTLQSPDQTSVRFTNTIDELAAAANRVLLNGSGVAAGDFDGDGWPDLFFTGLDAPCRLYRNLGGWKFQDVTASSGIVLPAKNYRSAVFADINGDGALDLLIATTGQGVLCFQNNGRGQFTEVTAQARLGGTAGSVTLALADVDGNGTLDLYVANNRTDDIRDRGQVDLRLVNGKPAVPPELADRLAVVDGQVLEFGEPDQLYLNDGRGHFAPVSWTGGRFRNEDGAPLTQPPRDWGLTATFRDINGDGFPDIYVCNDFWTPDRVWLNDGKGRFRLAPRLALRNMPSSSMGVDFADYDRDGDLDFFVVDMLSRDPSLRKRQRPAQNTMTSMPGFYEDRPQFMRNTLYRNRGDGTYAEVANMAGVPASDWSWSPVFLDADLDGYEDLLITAGHAHDVQDLDAEAQIRARQHPWTGFKTEADRRKAFTQELMEHMRLYPLLQMPVIAYRNLAGRGFAEMTAEWGTGQLMGVHHALALADFDRDGDLDFVVNSLGSAAGLYRNEATQPRVAVRLRGRAPNFAGIGANIFLRGGAVPLQSQEMISGGRYMAGDEALRVFAAGAGAGPMSLEVDWRSGKRTVITNVAANRQYEIDESAAVATTIVKPAAVQPLFEDVTALVNHRHHEEAFDDFARQPSLALKRSQAGPGVAWFDADGDGTGDLFIGSGRGGNLAGYRVRTGGAWDQASAFQGFVLPDDTTGMVGWTSPSGRRELLVGISGYETEGALSVLSVRVSNGTVSITNRTDLGTTGVGPMAVADFDGNGTLDLFAGGFVLAGRYPEACPNRIYRSAGDAFALDEANTKVIAGAGLVDGAIWSDLDGDGFAELVLACEWGPVRIFKNERGALREVTEPWGLAGFTGWWTGVAAGDFDGDGTMDLVAGNWGLNSEYHATAARPLVAYYGDLLERGTVDWVETEWDLRGQRLLPRRRLDVLSQVLPVLIERFPTHQQFSSASIENVLGTLAARAKRMESTTLASTVFLNRGSHFEAVPLPDEAQEAPVFGLNVADFDGDGVEDLFIAQNFFATTPAMPRLDAGRGLILRGQGNGRFEPVGGAQSGIAIYGEQRGSAVGDFDRDGRADIVVSQNGSVTRLFRNATGRPGIRVRANGAASNPDGIGLQVRLLGGDKPGPVREIRAGSGYFSQDDASLVMTDGRTATAVWVRWPGGETNQVAMIPGNPEVVIPRLEPR